jgi:dienelactone hydrolase
MGRSALLVLALAGLVAGCASRALPQQIPVAQPRPATLTGALYRPSGEGPFPAVVLLHGCGGIGPNMHAWAYWLQSEGYAALVLDSFSGRGLRRVCGDPALLTARARAHDVYAAARHVKALPDVDGARVGAIGWSHGGSTVLWASRLDQSYPDVTLKVLGAFYPGCGGFPGYRSSIPMLMLLGGRDNWAVPEPCKVVAAAARRDGKNLVAVLYPTAQHGFDSATLSREFFVPDARRGAGATVAYDPEAHADSEQQLRQFLQSYLRP